MARANRLDQLIDAWDPILKKAFLDSIFALRATAHYDQIVRMLEADDLDGAIRAVGLDPVAFRPFDRAIANAFEAGGNATANLVPVLRGADGFRTIFQFNVRNPAAEDWLAERSSTQVTDILDDQRVMIRNYLRAGMEAGNNPRTTALDLVGRIGPSGRREGGVIGLASSQEQWLRNYSEALASDNPVDALSVRRAAEAGEDIPAELRGSMIDAYEGRALRYRAETIARSESITALHEAQQQSMEQAIESGAISADTVTFIWRTAGDNRVRDAHESMDGQTVAMGEMFVDGDGNELEFPGDPNAPPETVVGCRCWREPSIDFLAGLE
jgi:F like protein